MITECKITTMENVMFVSTEFGNEYHVYGFIANTALPYALNLCPVTYEQFKKPMHRDHFKQLRDNGIYITPLTFIDKPSYKMERFNAIPEGYAHQWNEPDKNGHVDNRRKENFPDEGVFKMLARGNIGVFYIISEKPVDVPTYIRVGKFMSKCKVETRMLEHHETPETSFNDAGIILRAEDIDPSTQILEYEKIPIQHGMYLRNVRFHGKAIAFESPLLERTVSIPFGTRFYAVEEMAGQGA